MTVKSGQTWSGLIVCKDSTGAPATPSVGPVGALYLNGTVNAASVTVTGSNPYKWTLTLPALTAGDTVSMYITATIATIATAEVVAEEIADTIRLSDGVTVNSIANNAIPPRRLLRQRLTLMPLPMVQLTQPRLQAEPLPPRQSPPMRLEQAN